MGNDTVTWAGLDVAGISLGKSRARNTTAKSGAQDLAEDSANTSSAAHGAAASELVSADNVGSSTHCAEVLRVAVVGRPVRNDAIAWASLGVASYGLEQGWESLTAVGRLSDHIAEDLASTTAASARANAAIGRLREVVLVLEVLQIIAI